MLTKYYIEIDGIKHEIPQRCVKNWDEVKCAYKRADYSGITRSFTSQFEFVNEAYDMLMALYLRDGFNAVAVLSLYTITDRWEWVEQFSAPIDFSSLSWDNYVLKVNCIDNSLASLIKANKGTKYEFVVGQDIKTDGTFYFERLPITESVTYEYTGGTSDESTGTLSVNTDDVSNDRCYMGVVNEEISVGGNIYYQDDQGTEDGDYMLEAYKDVDVEYNFSVSYDIRYGMLLCSLVVRRADGTSTVVDSWSVGEGGYSFCGYFADEDALLAAYPNEEMTSSNTSYWAIINDEVWRVTYMGSNSRTVWKNQHQTLDEFINRGRTLKGKFSLSKGDKVWVKTIYHGPTRILSSILAFSWIATGDAYGCQCLSPITTGFNILRKICAGQLCADIEISGHDSRIAATRLIAAENIRGIQTAKFYSSFTEFCDWMETVFGYTYYIGERSSSPYKSVRGFGYINGTPYPITELSYQGDIDTGRIVYLRKYGAFVYFDDSKWYRYWSGWQNYNHPGTLHARPDTIYKSSDETLYYFKTESDGDLHFEPQIYKWDEEDVLLDRQTVYFVHRSELFIPDARIKKMAQIRDASYSVDSSAIYASVVIGYDKKDYDSINGRDEFNFNNTYVTGCSVTDKKLELKSKYRADCYGIEFAAQKRGADTTDSDTDKDVFFVLCVKSDDGYYIPDRSLNIDGALSDKVFNGAFSPMACVKANAGYIGMQAQKLHLEFASSDGNSDITIGDMAMSDDIDIETPLMTCGRISFTTDEVDEPASVNDLVEIESGGILYRGFVEEATFKYAKNEAVEYKLIVKDIEL